MPKGKPKSKNPEMYKVGGDTGDVKPVATPTAAPAVDQITNIITALADSVTVLTKEVKAIKEDLVQIKAPKVVAFQAPVSNSPNVVSPSLPVSATSFLTAVPRDLLDTATNILGDKFQFECEGCTDRPAFTFTVIVPAEYSKLKTEPDRRTKVIENSLGANGVKEWCALVKQSVVKYLGQQIEVKV